MKLLVIEDNQELRESLIEHLEEEGYIVDFAGDGDEGFYMAKNWEYDLIVLDIMLPGIDGFRVLEKLRKFKQTPVIMLTARDRVQDRIDGLDHGADDYLVKPFVPEELLARIRATLRRSVGVGSGQIKVGPIVMDSKQMRFSIDDKPVELTAREYEIMKILIERRDTVVPRHLIFDRLFDGECDSSSNMLDVYIYKLRNKFGKERIKTKRGMGIVFVSSP